VRTLRVIHESGTTTSRGTATGWVQGTGSQPGHMATYTTTGTRQTAAAKQAAPPQKRRNGAVLIGFGVGLAILALAYGFLMITNDLSSTQVVLTIAGVALSAAVLLLLIGAILAPGESRYNSQVYPDAIREWDRTWACQRCGTRFVA